MGRRRRREWADERTKGEDGKQVTVKGTLCFLPPLPLLPLFLLKEHPASHEFCLSAGKEI